MGSIGVKPDQKEPNRAQQGKMGPNKVKWGKTEPNGAKWGQNGPNRAKQRWLGRKNMVSVED